MTYQERAVAFVPAYADRYCAHCGFPFRGRDRSRQYCREYTDRADHGACEERRQNARRPDGLRERLHKTQEADPYARSSSDHAVAHQWVREHYPDVDLREWQPYQRPEMPDMAAVEPSPAHALNADVRETATDLLRQLVGVSLTTLTGRPNRILAVSPPHVIVATERSPQGQRVPIADLERALELLRRDGVVTITPKVIGHRSSFLGAVLLTLPGSQTTGSPPRLTIGPTHLSPASRPVKSGKRDGDRLPARHRPSATGNRHVFISYVREDSAAVDQLQEALEAAGIRVWRDTADLWPGEDWRAKIRSAITDDALVFLACFSSKSLARKTSYQNEELTLAIEQMRLRRPNEPWLVPVRFDDCEIPELNLGGGRSLSAIQRADVLPGSFDKGAERLTTAVLRILGGQDGFPQRR